jgi:hypothetical protein
MTAAITDSELLLVLLALVFFLLGAFAAAHSRWRR